MNRAIVHIDMNTFFVSCERLTNSELNGIPLIIGGGDRGVVAGGARQERRRTASGVVAACFEHGKRQGHDRAGNRGTAGPRVGRATGFRRSDAGGRAQPTFS